MSEAEARAAVAAVDGVSRETISLLERFVELLITGSKQQNLIARSTMPSIWDRHILDSLQLLPLVSPTRTWVDLGSGAGLPGMVIGIISEAQVTLVEARKKRVEFLNHVISELSLTNIQVLGHRAELLPEQRYDVISARAFAPLDRLLEIGQAFAGPDTQWVLPKGRSAQAELEAVQQTWQGEFRIERSVTDPDAAIIVASNVRRRKRK